MKRRKTKKKMTFIEAKKMIFLYAPKNVCGDAARNYIQAEMRLALNDRERATEILYAHANLSGANWTTPLAKEVKWALAAEYTRLSGTELVIGDTIDEDGNQL